MTFAEARKAHKNLLARKANGDIEPAAFRDAVNALRLTDAAGRWWQPDPSGEGWLVWDGATWAAADPATAFGTDATDPATPHPPPNQAGESQAATPTPDVLGPSATWFRDMLATLGSHLQWPSDFFREAREKKLAHRSQAWWDTLSLLGGGLGGYLWFVYSSVRGMPRLKFLSPVLSRESILDLLPALALLSLPAIAYLARDRLFSAAATFHGRSKGLSAQARWLLAGLTAIGLCLLNFDNSLLFRQREGLDFLTPLLMVALPAGIILLRRPLDALLAPLARLKQGVPAGVLVGASLVAPFATAYVLYALGIREYGLLHANIVCGTMLAYAIVRTPKTPATTGGATGMSASTLLLLLAAGVGLLLLWADPCLADDFLRDPFNFRDGLRTNGAAEVLAGVSTSVVSILVNGVEVAKVVIADTKPVKEGEDPTRSVFLVVARTVDPKGRTSTTLEQPENDPIYFYAHCEEAGKGRFRAGDPTLGFSLISGDGWVVLRDLGTAHDERCASVGFAAAIPQGTPPETVIVEITAGLDGLIGAQVPLTLVMRRPILEVT